jgi:hypothetical protein
MDVLTFYLDDTAPVITRRLSLQSGGDYDVSSNAQFRLRVRPLWGENLILDGIMTPDELTDTLSYRPAAGDLDAEGIYRAWIFIDFGGGVTQNTDEFQINVLVHGPGQGAEVGAIYRAARALEIVSWDSLRNYPDYGDPELQRVIELAKLRVLGTPCPGRRRGLAGPPHRRLHRQEGPRRQRALRGDLLLDGPARPAERASGNTDEVKTYPDRIRAIEEAIKRFRDDLERQAGELAPILGPATIYEAPALDTAGPLLTPGLDEYPALPISYPSFYRVPRR